MKKLFIVAIGFFILALPLSVHAISYTYDLFNFTGDPAKVSVEITDLANSIQFDLNVLAEPTTGNIGDLRGFWFNIDPYPFGPLSFDETTDPYTPDFISGSHVSSYLVSDNSVQNFGPTITPAGPFDVGVEFGTPGIGSDDIRNTTFYVRKVEGISIEDLISQGDPEFNSLFAARLTSVGREGFERDGSSKLIVPEPATMLLLGSGLLGFAAARRKKKLFKK